MQTAMERRIDGFRENTRKWPGDPLAWMQLGHAYMQERRWKEAADAVREAVRVDPRQARAWYYLGLIYLELGDTEGVFEVDRTLSRLSREEAKAEERLREMGPVLVVAGDTEGLLDVAGEAEELEEDISGVPRDRSGAYRLKDVAVNVRYVDKTAPPGKQRVRWIGLNDHVFWTRYRYIARTDIPDDTYANFCRGLKPGAGLRGWLKHCVLWLRWFAEIGAGPTYRSRARALLRRRHADEGGEPAVVRVHHPGTGVYADFRPLYDTPDFTCVYVG